jgi:tetratricopeptide (TPR) repeat protein
LEPLYKNNPNDFNIALELGKLNMLSMMRPKDVFPILKRAKELDPQSPMPYKYLAIAYVESSYEYNNAILELKEYIKIEPDNVFGRNFLGYLYFCIADYENAIDEFKKALALESDNCYAYCKLSRSYGMLYLNGTKLDLRRNQNRKFVLEMFNKAKSVKNPDDLRLWWLECWLQKNGFLDNK